MFDPTCLPTRPSLAETSHATGDGIEVERLSGIGIHLLQGPDQPGFPARTGRITSVDGFEIWCLRPSEWLAFGDGRDVPPERDGLYRHDLSDAFASLSIAGPNAADLLQGGITVPLSGLEGDRFIRTLCGAVPVYIRKSGPEAFRLHFDSSLADHYWRWLKWKMQ